MQAATPDFFRMNDLEHKRLFWAVILVCIVVSCGADLFNPSLTSIQKHFGLSAQQTSWVLNANFAGLCMVTLIAGLLGDRFDKRSLVVGGLALFMLGSFLAMNASSFGILLLGRFVQGAGAAFPAVLVFVVLIEWSPSSTHAKLAGLVSGTVTVAMCIAPLAGSFIAGAWGWRASFGALLAIAACATCLAIAFLPTSPATPRTADSRISYRLIATSGEWWILAIIVNLLRGNYLAFSSISSMLYIGELGTDIHAFGFYQGALALTFALASAGSGRIIAALGEWRSVVISLVAMPVVSGLMLFYVVSASVPSALAITFFMVAISVFVVFPINVLHPKSLSIAHGAFGRASAASNTVKFLATGFLVWCFALPIGHRASWIAALLFVSYLLCLCVFLAARPGGRSWARHNLTE